MYDVVIGIEIHMELKTKTKMFSSSPYVFKKNANTCVNEVDIALPGTLPCVNKEAVIKALQACKALNLTIDPLVRFDRKNYYYSDLPKGYQITQQFHPIGSNGYVEIKTEQGLKKIRINRIHMEEDTAKQFHLRNNTLIDYNRAGVPLIEIVSEPDMSSGKEAALYADKLRQTMEYIGVSSARMDEGSMRCDVNISLKEKGSSIFGTKVEIKNLNSLANIETAIDYEIKRQSVCLLKGEKIEQETRRFDETTSSTISMRKKEGAVDYKYFPEPNIFPIKLSSEFIAEALNKMAELPDIKAKRFKDKYELSDYDISLLIANHNLCSFFEETMLNCNSPKIVCNYLISEISGLLTKRNETFSTTKLTPFSLAKLIKMLEAKNISSSQAKELLVLMLDGQDPETIVAENDIKQVSDVDTLTNLLEEALKENPQCINDFKNGITHVKGFLVGQVMKKSKGQANPKLVAEMVSKELAKY